MTKKGRLGSDPLSWIGDSRSEEEKPKADKSEPESVKSEPVKPVEIKIPEKPVIVPIEKKTEPVQTEIKPVPEVKVEKKTQEPAAMIKSDTKVTQKPSQAPVKLDKNIESRSMDLLNKSPKKESGGSGTTTVKKNLELEGKYLTFVLADEDYGIEINKVKEILGLLPITRVPRTLVHVKGVINLRGKIVSVIDMRSKFGMSDVEHTEETCIIVIQTKVGEKGIIVDRVSEVLNFKAENIDSVPAFGIAIDTDYILGMGKMGNNVKILLDIEKVLLNNGQPKKLENA